MAAHPGKSYGRRRFPSGMGIAVGVSGTAGQAIMESFAEQKAGGFSVIVLRMRPKDVLTELS